MKYLGVLDNMYDKARVAVSDFCLGKTNINTLAIGDSTNEIEEIMSKLDELIGKNRN